MISYLVLNSNLLGATNKFMIDVVIGGALISKTPETTYELLEELASINYQWSVERYLGWRHVA